MANQTNILDFDDVRRASVARRSSAAPMRSRARSRSAGYGRPSISRDRSDSDVRTRRSVSYDGTARSPRAAISGGSARDLRSQDREAGDLRGRIRSARQDRTKARAEKQFNRQYAGNTTSSAAREGAPRAALYRGEMGTRQKRATRMQSDSTTRVETSDVKAKRRRFKHAPALVAVAAAVLCVVFACNFLYTPAQTYYLSVRQHDQLQAEYEAVLERNDALQSELNTLSTEEGLKQYAHDQYGWVSDGENAVVVQGLSDGSENGMDDVTANVVPGSVSAPETWYSGVLDPFFGYNQ